MLGQPATAMAVVAGSDHTCRTVAGLARSVYRHAPALRNQESFIHSVKALHSRSYLQAAHAGVLQQSGSSSGATAVVDGTCSKGLERRHEESNPIPATSMTPTSTRRGNSSSRHTWHELQQLLRSEPSMAERHPMLLTAAITACSSCREAAQLFAEHSAAFNHIHVAAFVSRLAKVKYQLARLHQNQLMTHQLLSHTQTAV